MSDIQNNETHEKFQEQDMEKANYQAELIYQLEDRPPLKETLFAAFQHLLAIFVAIITPTIDYRWCLKA